MYKNKSYSLVNMVKNHYNSITYYAFYKSVHIAVGELARITE